MNSSVTGIPAEKGIQDNKKIPMIQKEFDESKVDAEFQKIYAIVKTRADKLRVKTAETVFPMIHQVLVEKGYKYVMHKPVAHGLLTKEMDCNIISGLYVDLGKKLKSEKVLNFDIEAGYFPGHVFVIGKGQDGKDYWWEATSGGPSDEEMYADKLTPELIKQGYPIKISAENYLWTHHIEMAGLLIEKGNLLEAKEFYEKALKIEARNLESMVGLATIYLIMGSRDSDIKTLETAQKLVLKAAQIKFGGPAIPETDPLHKLQKDIDAEIESLLPLNTESAKALAGPWEVEHGIQAESSTDAAQDLMALDIKMRDAAGKAFILSIQSISYDPKTQKPLLKIQIKALSGVTQLNLTGAEALQLLKDKGCYGNTAWMQKAFINDGKFLSVNGDSTQLENPNGARFMVKAILWAKQLGLSELSVHLKDTGRYSVNLLPNKRVEGSFIPSKHYLSENNLDHSIDHIWKSQFVFINDQLYTPIGYWNIERLQKLDKSLDMNSSADAVLAALNKKMGLQTTQPPTFQIDQNKQLFFSVLGTTRQHEELYGKLIGEPNAEPGLFFDPQLNLKTALKNGVSRVSYAKQNIAGPEATKIIEKIQSQENEQIKNVQNKNPKKSYAVLIPDFDGDRKVILTPNTDSPSGGYLVQQENPQKTPSPARPPYENKTPKQMLVRKMDEQVPARKYESDKASTYSPNYPTPAPTGTKNSKQSETDIIRKDGAIVLDDGIDELLIKSTSDPLQLQLTEDKLLVSDPAASDSIAIYKKSQIDHSKVFDEVLKEAINETNIPQPVEAIQDSDHVAPLGMIFKTIPGGKCKIGHPKVKSNQPKDVVISGFHMKKTHVTEKEYAWVMRYKKIANLPTSIEGENKWVENVSWPNAVEFCKQLSLIAKDISPETKKKIKSMGAVEYQKYAFENPELLLYRLPTEYEWEYAARGNQNSKKELFRNESNPFGLVDMLSDKCHEWTGTWASDQTEGGINPSGPKTGTKAIIRNSYASSDKNASDSFKSAHRKEVDTIEILTYGVTGLRPVRSMDSAKPRKGKTVKDHMLDFFHEDKEMKEWLESH
jgi:tetratricopeptide (TPR) repeat protein